MMSLRRQTTLRTALLCGACVLLGACSSLSARECQLGDWRGIGYNDGAAGRSATYLARHAEACAKVGVQPDAQAWHAGRGQGLLYYCTPANAYRVGRAGHSLSAVCAPSQLPALQHAWQRGNDIYRLQSEVDNDRRELDRLRLQLEQLSADSVADQSRQMQILWLRMELLRDRLFFKRQRLEQLTARESNAF